MISSPSQKAVVAETGAVAWRLSPLLPLERTQDRQVALLSILATANEKGIPLVPLLKAFASEHRFWYRDAIRRLATRIASGESLSTALLQTPGLLPEGAVLAIHSATNEEALSSVYTKLVNAYETETNTSSMRVVATILYWIMFSIPALFILSGIAYFILPTFVKMFDEFGLKLAPPVKLIYSITNNFTLPFLLTTQLIGLLLFLYWFTPIRTSAKQWLYRWNAGLSTSRYRRELLIGAAVAAGSGTDLSEHFRHVAIHSANRTLRTKAKGIGKHLIAQVCPWTAMGRVGLVSNRQAVALSQMKDDAVRSWALLRIVEREEDNSRKRIETLFTVLHPIVVFIFGAFVLGVCFATFQPLTGLIHALS